MTPAQQPSMTAAEQCRLQTGLTLAEAARRIGVSRQTLYDWKRNDPERFTAELEELKAGQPNSNQNKIGNPTMNIDRKYSIDAVNPVSGKRHTEKDSVLFLAKDEAFLKYALPAYLKGCEELGSNPEHLESIKLLTGRVGVFQETESKTPDTIGKEVDRCVNGQGV
jgi:hypothetical protein